MRLLKLVPDDTNIKFLRWRVPFYVFSCLLILGAWALIRARLAAAAVAQRRRYTHGLRRWL